MGESLTLHVRNKGDAIAPANEAAETWLTMQEISPEATFFAGLTIEELVTNCIKYGYDDSGEHIIDIELSVANHTLTITVVDDGRAFDPLSVSPPDMSGAIEDRPIGGLGIHMLRELADNMAYERRDNTNRVTLIKRMP
ncbi:MAG TPA: ATP-binding protein [Candidatus Saccharimonadales bacterium]|nr:ATP-binding protein [Candidatus Saccharimonadales bacterium]